VSGRLRAAARQRLYVRGACSDASVPPINFTVRRPNEALALEVRP